MSKNNTKNNKALIIASVILAVLALASFLLMLSQRPQPIMGGKSITFVVIHKDQTSKSFEISTNAEYLRQALEEQNLVAGDESAMGLFVQTINGETVNAAAQEWWCFTKSSEELNTGIDNTPIADGEQYEATFTVGW